MCHNSGESALHDATQSQFAAVVLDLLMPEMDGFEFLERFRAIEKHQGTPVIVWTSKDIDGADARRLKRSAQTIALKNRDSIDTVLKELRLHAPPTSTATTIEEPAIAR